MKSHDKKVKDSYVNLALNKADKAIIAGRYAFDEGKEALIVKDIISKMDFRDGQSFFDIGCGAGVVTEALISHLLSLDTIITLMDAGEIIDILSASPAFTSSAAAGKIALLKGYFPEEYSKEEKYDRILMYSVAHCTDDPFEMITQAAARLNVNGKLMVGDLPNISQKGRFLASAKGREFEADYKKTSLHNITVYKDHHDYVSQMKADPDYYSEIDDGFINRLYTHFTNRGYDVFLLPQPEGLPFNFTRHDLLVRRYD